MDINKTQDDITNNSLSVLTKEKERIDYEHLDQGELLKGQKLEGSFTASENYLGQVLIRFYNFGRINPDSVIFRIKEKGKENWYYENTYKTDQFQPDLFFTFGFPIIESSRGKTYVFEIESLDGESENSIGLSSVRPLSVTLYQYPKALLLRHPKLFANFIIKNKIGKIGLNRDTFISIGIYFNFIVLTLLLEFILLQKISSGFKLKVIDGSRIIVIGILILFLSAIFLYINKTELSLALTDIAYFILVAGVVYALWEAKRSKSSK